jgi:hypothetical protein
VLLMASFVPFLVYFMLSWRDHLRRSFLYLFNSAGRQVVGKSWEGVANMVRAYVIGNFILGFMLAALSTLFFVAIRLPYWPIVGPLSGFLSLVPGYSSAPARGLDRSLHPAGDLRHDHRGSRPIAFDRAQSALSQSGRLACSLKPPRGDHRAHVLGHSVGRSWFVGRHTDHRCD